MLIEIITNIQEQLLDITSKEERGVGRQREKEGGRKKESV